jgi:hypothetical protein
VTGGAQPFAAGSTNWQYVTITYDLATIGMTAGQFNQIEWVRKGNDGTDSLTGDLYLARIDAILSKTNWTFEYYADQMRPATNADAAVNADSPLAADSLNAGLKILQMNDTTEQGRMFTQFIPIGATRMTVYIRGRAETAPGATAHVIHELYYRQIPDNGPTGAWSPPLVLSTLAVPTNTNWQYYSQQLTLATLGTPISNGKLYQFQFTREADAVGDDLVGNWDLLQIALEFS